MISEPGTAEAERPSLTRRALCYAAIVSAVPYLVLKVLWATGSRVGITDPQFGDDGSLLVLNVLTLAMDAAAIALVLAFTYPWGQRVPAWLVLLPVFVGCGLLGPIVVGIPVAVVATALVDAPPPQAALPLAGWVYPLVYGGFMLLGIFLVAAFWFYARSRWPQVFTARTPKLSGTEWSLTAVGSPLALTAAVLLLVDAFQPSEVQSSAAAVAVVRTLFALAAVVGVVGFYPYGGRRFAPPMLAGWFGASSLVAWGAWGVLTVLGGATVVARADTMEVVGALAQLLGGALLALVLIRAQRRVTAREPEGARRPASPGRAPIG